MQKLDKNFRWPVSASQQIGAPREDVWRIISAPGNLELGHPFCKRNPVLAWDRENSRDEVHYLSGRVYERRFREWHDGYGYDLDIYQRDQHLAAVSWRLADSGDANCTLQITVFPMPPQRWPLIVRWLAHWLRLKPYLRSYLRSVVMGFDWYITRGERVPRNQFGRHPWFSAE